MFSGQEEMFAFERTISRMTEMQVLAHSIKLGCFILLQLNAVFEMLQLIFYRLIIYSGILNTLVKV